MLCWVCRGIPLVTPQTNESILRWGRHWHRCKPDIFISLSSYDDQVKPGECSATPTNPCSSSLGELWDSVMLCTCFIPVMFHGPHVGWICWVWQGIGCSLLMLCSDVVGYVRTGIVTLRVEQVLVGERQNILQAFLACLVWSPRWMCRLALPMAATRYTDKAHFCLWCKQVEALLCPG